MKFPQNQKENIVGLHFLYSLEFEISYVQNLVKKFVWYLEQGYPSELILLPQGVTQHSTEEEVTQALQVEYDAADYAACAASLQEEWRDISGGFEKMCKEPVFRLGDEYSVVLTKYGTGGNYNVTMSRVTIRINAQSSKKMAATVVHEIIHMTIQYLIDQYRVRHWRKERLVDLLVERYFPGLKKMQMIKEDVSMVDSAFSESFPDIEAIVRSIRSS